MNAVRALAALALAAAVVVSGGAGGHAASGADDAAQPPSRTRTRPFPDTTARIAILTDQLSGAMSDAQVRFAATHFVGTQKLTLDTSRRLRAVNPGFLVLHYRLGLWQSAPHVQYIVDGTKWSNDFPEVTRHESWFWHNPAGHRVASNQDGKLLMNIADDGFRAYWRESIAAQARAGDYDGVFFDSASPALLQWEARTPPDRRLLGTGVRFNRFPELGGKTWIEAWEEWIADLDRYLAERGIALIPNVGALATSWDNTDYSRTAGVFCEGFLDPAWAEDDWLAAADQTLRLAAQGKIVILQNYLASPDDVSKRKYLLANYLLVKGRHTYLAYFAGSALSWFPEWSTDLGSPLTPASRVAELRAGGVYRRDYTGGMVLVNPSNHQVHVALDGPFRRVDPVGGGPVGPDGRESGTLVLTAVTSVDLPPKSAEVLLRGSGPRN